MAIERAEDSVLEACPEEIKRFTKHDDVDLRLTKIENFREGFVYEGSGL